MGGFLFVRLWQPPSGGCVLKHTLAQDRLLRIEAAAFGRLCVETCFFCSVFSGGMAAAFGRLCVETHEAKSAVCFTKAAAFGRLCVETLDKKGKKVQRNSSRLRAAVC